MKAILFVMAMGTVYETSKTQSLASGEFASMAACQAAASKVSSDLTGAPGGWNDPGRRGASYIVTSCVEKGE